MKPRISVIVPAYNETGYLERCLRAINHQNTATAYEVIVVDNNSTDATASIAKRLGAKVVSEKKPGICSARQRGLIAAKGEIIVSTDADSQVPKAWLKKIELTLNNNPEIVGVAGSIHYTNAPSWAHWWTGGLFGATNLSYRIFGQPFYVSACNLAFRRAAFGSYDSTLNQGGDELDVLRQLRTNGTVVFDATNVVKTSSRRLRKGFLYNIVVTFLFYYLLGYSLSRLMKRPILTHYPVFRGIPTTPQISPLYVSLLTVLCSIVLVRLGRSGHLHVLHISNLHIAHRIRI
jgi:glycosyltransferase involved in cell wall biosynthesis